MNARQQPLVEYVGSALDKFGRPVKNPDSGELWVVNFYTVSGIRAWALWAFKREPRVAWVDIRESVKNPGECWHAGRHIERINRSDD